MNLVWSFFARARIRMGVGATFPARHPGSNPPATRCWRCTEQVGPGARSGLETGAFLATRRRKLPAQRGSKRRNLGDRAGGDAWRAFAVWMTPSVRASVDWLLRVVGAEHNMWTRTGSFLHLIKARLDVSHEGWPWRDGNATWIEPTAHTLDGVEEGRRRLSRRGSGTARSGWRGSDPEPPLHRWRLELRNSEHAVCRSAFVSRRPPRWRCWGWRGARNSEFAGALGSGRAIPRRDQIFARKSLAADRAALSWPECSGAGGKRLGHRAT